MNWKPLIDVVDPAVRRRHCRAANLSYIRFSPRDNKYKGKMASFVFFREALVSLGWKPGITRLGILVDSENKQLRLIQQSDGRVLSFDGGLDKAWCRLHCPEKLAPVLREWLQVDASKKTQVVLKLEPIADCLTIGFGAKLEHEKKLTVKGFVKTNTTQSPALQEDSSLAGDPMLRWFSYDHLPDSLRRVSVRFFELAHNICAACEPGVERTAALRKLLEAKDAAVRAKIFPGG